MKHTHNSRRFVRRGFTLTIVAAAAFSAAQLLLPSRASADHINTTDFVITIDTTKPGSPGTEFTIPTTGAGYRYNVDCDGDSVPEATNQTGNYTCQYATPGVRQVRISGAFPRIHFNNSGDKLKLLSIDQWGTNSWTDMNGAFYGAANMDVKATDTPDVSRVTNMSGMFQGAASLRGESANWANWNTARVRAMDNTFNGARQFNQSIDSWNTSEVRYMNGTFANAKAFNQPLNSWDTRNVTSLKNTFNGADVFNQPLANWVTDKVTSTFGMFANTKAFNQDITGWNMATVTDMGAMFQNATAFNQPVGTWTTTKLRNTSNMFNGAVSFDRSLANWNVAALERAENMFHAVKLSLRHYDATLQSWGTQPVRENVPFSGGKSIYCLALNEHRTLTDVKRWTITDAGHDCEQYFPTAVIFTGPTSVDENSPVDMELGTLETTSPLGAADSFTYATGCAGNFPQDREIKIEGNKVKLAQSPDYEANTRLRFCVRATSSIGATIDKAIVLRITDRTALKYDANGATGGVVPVSAGEVNAVGATVPASANTGSLVKAGHTFDGWNTAENGLGTSYAPGDMVPLDADVTLYAQWRDATPPAKPVVAPNMAATDDSGVSDTDNITSTKQPSFTLRCTESGSRVTLYVDGTPSGTANCDAIGEVKLRTALPLTEGVRTVTYTETDRSGNVSPQSPSLTLVIDTTVPDGAIGTLQAATQSPSLAGTVDDPAAMLELTIQGTAYKVTNLKNGSWELPEGMISPGLAEGTYAIALRMIDAAGNEKTVHGELAVAYRAASLPPVAAPASSSAGTPAQSAVQASTPNTGHQRNTTTGLLVAIGGGVVAIAGVMYIVLQKRKRS